MTWFFVQSKAIEDEEEDEEEDEDEDEKERSDIRNRIPDPALSKPFEPQQARIAPAAGRAAGVRIITTRRQRIIDAQIQAAADDLGLGELNQRRVDRHMLASFHG